MLEPKTFYRKLDALLTTIGREKSGKNFLFTILRAIEQNFSVDLHISNGRIYEEVGDEFVQVRRPGQSKSMRGAVRLAADAEAVKLLLKYGSYIYDDPALSIDRAISQQEEYAIPAAFTVGRSPNERWIVVFELKAGWVREEIEFCMNAVRAALNYRLFSDAVKSGLEQAAHIQNSLLPQTPPHIQGYEIAGRSQPAELVGGDLFDYFPFSNEMFGVSIGDASGHGLPAALLVRDVVTGLRMGLEEQMKMVHTLKKLNRVIHRSTYSTRFVSLFYGEIESNGHIIYANAGHPSPLLIRGTAVTELRPTGIILGALPELAIHRSLANFEPGAVMAMYSDGIFERRNPEGEAFGLERLQSLIMTNQEKSAAEILETVFNTVFAFGENAKWEDDATLVIIKRLAA
ncbi:MAG: PP2C family protein-serine/threonine phosphatase [candidate division KSB1 bacterium]|nr:PP2C family protein-serine/threonine phosphatase [candidate division KSB1 bacterium]MDZ7272918.1 PP2C family protein-serine/threonine phosphatase [candidate division KSB1 bacterium]MDZ7284060.1 PP2C family protein-serine/threonine phosphatase [candidate division KSB1 bacterium]MDZ7297543.1 PP2C family protein-serine/threonine phosphatase [candidate division KSB1 bacterium]MDZ7309177.1 PP2C family protein-serine/threonine phosphatase [candidate division KSB1 bacterium]